MHVRALCMLSGASMAGLWQVAEIMPAPLHLTACHQLAKLQPPVALKQNRKRIF